MIRTIYPMKPIAYIFTAFLLAFLLLAPLEALHTAEQVAAVNAGKPRD